MTEKVVTVELNTMMFSTVASQKDGYRFKTQLQPFWTVCASHALLFITCAHFRLNLSQQEAKGKIWSPVQGEATIIQAC